MTKYIELDMPAVSKAAKQQVTNQLHELFPKGERYVHRVQPQLITVANILVTLNMIMLGIVTVVLWIGQ